MPIKIKYKPGEEPPVPPTLEEIFNEIGTELKRLNHSVSDERQHAVESQLRGIVRRAGFRFRETKGTPLSLKEIYDQAEIALNACKFEIKPIKLGGKLHTGHVETALGMAGAVLSNLKAESGLSDDIEKEVPLPKETSAV